MNFKEDFRMRALTVYILYTVNLWRKVKHIYHLGELYSSTCFNKSFLSGAMKELLVLSFLLFS